MRLPGGDVRKKVSAAFTGVASTGSGRSFSWGAPPGLVNGRPVLYRSRLTRHRRVRRGRGGDDGTTSLTLLLQVAKAIVIFPDPANGRGALVLGRVGPAADGARHFAREEKTGEEGHASPP